jgi:hypothetical protein
LGTLGGNHRQRPGERRELLVALVLDELAATGRINAAAEVGMRGRPRFSDLP